jgi:hypothetical protein
LAADGAHQLIYQGVTETGEAIENCQGSPFDVQMQATVHAINVFKKTPEDETRSLEVSLEAKMNDEMQKRFAKNSAFDSANMMWESTPISLTGFGYHHKKTFSFAGGGAAGAVINEMFFPTIVPFAAPSWILYDNAELAKLPLPVDDADSLALQAEVEFTDQETACDRSETEPDCNTDDVTECKQKCGENSDCGNCWSGLTDADRDRSPDDPFWARPAFPANSSLGTLFEFCGGENGCGKCAPCEYGALPSLSPNTP